MTIILELTAQDLGIDSVDSIDFSSIPEVFLANRRSEVIDAYAKVTGMTADDIENKYEGGIDEWIGFGSVTCYELDGSTMVGYGCNSIKMTIT